MDAFPCVHFLQKLYSASIAHSRKLVLFKNLVWLSENEGTLHTIYLDEGLHFYLWGTVNKDIEFMLYLAEDKSVSAV